MSHPLFRRFLPVCALALLMSSCTDMPNGYTTTAAPGFNEDGAYRRPSLVTTDAPAPPHDSRMTAAAATTIIPTSPGMAPPPPATEPVAMPVSQMPPSSSTAVQQPSNAPIPLAITPQVAATDLPAPIATGHAGSMDQPQTAMPRATTMPMQPAASSKMAMLDGDLGALQKDSGAYQDRLTALQGKSDIAAARYFDIVASINTALQSSSGVGAQALSDKAAQAHAQLDDISQSVDALKTLSGDVDGASAKAQHLQDDIHAAATSPEGMAAHDRAMTLTDGVDHQVAQLAHLGKDVGDEITRRSAYLRNENLHMQTLALAIGKHSDVAVVAAAPMAPAAPALWAPVDMREQHRPLVFIRFNHPDVKYEDALYASLNDALKRYPEATFELVAVSPLKNTELKTEETRRDARKDGEAVLKTLTAMGMPMERLTLRSATAAEITSNEVRLYLQ